MKISLTKSFLVFLLLVAFISGCAVQSTRHATRAYEFLYPDNANIIVSPGTPVLNLPLRVGIAFVPGEGGGIFGTMHTPNRDEFILTDDNKISLMGEVAKHFSSNIFVKDIQLIPPSDLSPGGSFANLDRISSVYGVDVVALLSYDQIQVTDDTVDQLTFWWTLFGPFIIPGTSNDTDTMLDVAIFDIKSRKMLFRAPGTSHIKGIAPSVWLSQKMHKDSGEGLALAVKDMLANLDEQLARFTEKVKESPSEFKVNNTQK